MRYPYHAPPHDEARAAKIVRDETAGPPLNADRIGICPCREELISGLLGSSIVGFQTQQHCNNFIDSVASFEWPVHWLDQVPPVPEARAAVRRDPGLADDALLGVGIDRLYYTKGIEERLRVEAQGTDVGRSGVKCVVGNHGLEPGAGYFPRNQKEIDRLLERLVALREKRPPR